MIEREERGPIYGVTLIDSLPLNESGWKQQMPGRQDLLDAMQATKSSRVVAGFEVLLAHYKEKCDEVEQLKSQLKILTNSAN